MPGERIIVLKFGGSVLQEPKDVHRAAQEIYRWRREGFQVVAVVSAIGNTTDELTRLSRDFGDCIEPQKTAVLLATGELQSAALLGLALDRAGISSFVCDETSLGLLTTGEVVDAEPEELDAALLRCKLQQRGVVVLPGFIGRHRNGDLTLLGRGGSDLTALFVASRLGAERCRLIKDVDGLFEYDPKLQSRSPRRFRRLRYEDALKLDESIVQHKAVRFAQAVDLQFEVSSLLSAELATQVGNFAESRLTSRTWHDQQIARRRSLKVAIVGLGTVGFGVYRQLTELFGEDFEVIAVAVRDWRKAIRNGIPVGLIASSVDDAICTDCDVVVELVGGVEQPLHWVSSALRAGKHVVTANKSLVAQHRATLEKLACENGVRLIWSAAVGGSLPALETVRQFSAHDKVVEVAGVLNGTTNFVLDLVGQGKRYSEALALAQEAGLTEQDPYYDLGGIDAAEKLVLLANCAGYGLNPDDVIRHELNASLVHEFDWNSGLVLRQIACLERQNGKLTAAVTVQAVNADSVWSKVRSAANLIEIRLASGRKIMLQGHGAGRWPTTASVIGDLWELAMAGRRQAKISQRLATAIQVVGL